MLNQTSQTTSKIKVLDAGCGLGRYLYYFSKRHNSECFGVDLDPSNIEIAKIQLRQNDY